MSNATNPITGSCNVLCTKSPYHSYQESNGILNFAGIDSNGNATLISALDTVTFQIPNKSIFLGVICFETINASSLTGIAAGEATFWPLKPGLGQPIEIASDLTNLNILEVSYAQRNNDLPDDSQYLLDAIKHFQNLPFATCKGLILSGGQSEPNQSRSIGINNNSLINRYCIFAYLDYSWIYQ